MQKNRIYTEEQKEIFKFGKILLGLVIIIALLYLFTIYVINKPDTYERTNKKGVIQYSSILLGTMLNKADKEYYVIVLDTKDLSNTVYLNKVSDYKAKNNHLPIYIADLSNELNKSFISDKSYHNNDSMDDFKVTGTTLIKVNNGKVTKFIEDAQSLLNELE